VAGIHAWLVDECINWSNIGAACEFGLTDEGRGEAESEYTGGIITIQFRCINVARGKQACDAVYEEGLRGLRRETATILFDAVLNPEDPYEELDCLLGCVQRVLRVCSRRG
jgi:hypothetical protein